MPEKNPPKEIWTTVDRKTDSGMGYIEIEGW